MWYKLGAFILKNRLPLLIFVVSATVFMGYQASKVQLSYEFSRAIPVDNPKYLDYQNFKEKFGQDGSTMVIGIETKDFYATTIFNEVALLHQNLKNVNGVQNILSIPEAVTLIKDSVGEKLVPQKIFLYPYLLKNFK